jgi:ribosomal protein S20
MAEEKKQKKPTAVKRIIQSEKKRLSNKAFLSKVKTATKTLNKSINDKDEYKKNLNLVFSLLDKGSKKRIINKSKVARLKSKYSSI